MCTFRSASANASTVISISGPSDQKTRDDYVDALLQGDKKHLTGKKYMRSFLYSSAAELHLCSVESSFAGSWMR